MTAAADSVNERLERWSEPHRNELHHVEAVYSHVPGYGRSSTTDWIRDSVMH